VAVVTISRQYGAGGLRVGPAVAEALGFRFADRELVELAAERLGLAPEVARARDERVPAIVEEIGLALAAGTPPFGAAPPFPAERALGDQALAEATQRVIRSLADAGGYVILGRGAQAALSERRDACHISLVGDGRDRARRVAASQGVDEKEALARCERVDAERAAYVRRFYGVDIGDPLLYDCVLNTSRLSLEAVVDIAVEAARRRLAIR
jgi:cytidylate kinase